MTILYLKLIEGSQYMGMMQLWLERPYKLSKEKLREKRKHKMCIGKFIHTFHTGTGRSWTNCTGRRRVKTVNGRAYSTVPVD
jgi:hypothetical protein